MKKYLTILGLLILLLQLSSCRKEEYAWAPVYGKVYCTSSHPVVGDTVVLTVEVYDAGNRLNRAEYRWTVKDPYGEVSKTYSSLLRKSGSQSITKVPSLEYVFKEEGKHSLSLTALFSYSMRDAQAIMKGSAQAYGEIRVYSK